MTWVLAGVAMLLPAAITAEQDGREPKKIAAAPVALESSLRMVQVTLPGGKPRLVAGEEGTLELRLSLDPAAGSGRSLAWGGGDEPVTVRVSAPEKSGVTFQGSGKDSPAMEATITAPAPKNGTEPFSVKLPYAVSSRVQVKEYPLQFFLSVPLSANGSPLQDSGLAEHKIRVETPLRTKVLVLIVIALAIFLFVVEWVRVDVVAMMMMVSLPLLNLLSSRDTFSGLSSNAVVAIIGVMIVSAGLNSVGLVSRVVRPVINLAGTSSSRLMIFLSGLIALISSVMQNTGAAVLFLPGIRHACKEIKIPISSILMPIGMCAILGGTLTMIGTSPLILLNDILPAGMDRFALMELTPIGAALVVGGILYFVTIGRFFLKKIAVDQQARKGASAEEETQDLRSFYHELEGPFELAVPAGFSPPRGEPLTVAEARREHQITIVAMIDDRGQKTLPPSPTVKLRTGQVLCAYGPRAAVTTFIERFGLELRDRPLRFRDLFNPAVAGTVEAVVSPRSSMIGSTIREVGFRRTFGVTVMGLFREGKTYYRDMLDIPLLPGDAFLLHATWEHFHRLQDAHRGIVIITPLEVEIQKPSKSVPAVACFLTALTLMLVSSFYFQKLPYNPIPLSVCLMVGAVGMVLTGVLSIRDAYAAVDWRTVFLLGGLIPLGMAVDRTGTAEWIATGVVSALGASVTPLVLLAVLGVMSSAFCLVISNVGACTLLVPLGVSMAAQIGVDPRVAAIVVGIGVSNSFLLPTHQVNALYMGPGDYRTKDYMKIGGILSLLYITILVSMTYLFYLK